MICLFRYDQFYPFSYLWSIDWVLSVELCIHVHCLSITDRLCNVYSYLLFSKHVGVHVHVHAQSVCVYYKDVYLIPFMALECYA